MDRTVKFLLGLIAFSLISLNLQLAGFELVGEAKAETDVTKGGHDGRQLFNELRGIRHALCEIAGKEPAQTLGDAPLETRKLFTTNTKVVEATLIWRGCI